MVVDGAGDGDGVGGVSGGASEGGIIRTEHGDPVSEGADSLIGGKGEAEVGAGSGREARDVGDAQVGVGGTGKCLEVDTEAARVGDSKVGGDGRGEPDDRVAEVDGRVGEAVGSVIVDVGGDGHRVAAEVRGGPCKSGGIGVGDDDVRAVGAGSLAVGDSDSQDRAGSLTKACHVIEREGSG